MYAKRAKKGERLTAVDDAGTTAIAETVAFAADKITLRLIEILPPEPPPKYSLTLAQCVLKGDKTEFLVQKATELGATSFVPLTSANCVVRFADDAKAAAKVARWQKIADEAAKQCGGTPVQVANVTPLAAFLQNLPAGALLVFCHENERRTAVGTILKEENAAKNVILLVGPEGGFTLEEAAAVKAAKGRAATLGRRILRAETAALVALVAVQYEKGEL